MFGGYLKMPYFCTRIFISSPAIAAQERSKLTKAKMLSEYLFALAFLFVHQIAEIAQLVEQLIRNE